MSRCRSLAALLLNLGFGRLLWLSSALLVLESRHPLLIFPEVGVDGVPDAVQQLVVRFGRCALLGVSLIQERQEKGSPSCRQRIDLCLLLLLFCRGGLQTSQFLGTLVDAQALQHLLVFFDVSRGAVARSQQFLFRVAHGTGLHKCIVLSAEPLELLPLPLELLLLDGVGQRGARHSHDLLHEGQRRELIRQHSVIVVVAEVGNPKGVLTVYLSRFVQAPGAPELPDDVLPGGVLLEQVVLEDVFVPLGLRETVIC